MENRKHRGELRCIICGEKRDGLAVKEDYVINAIRWFKKNVTKNEQGYSLVVCKEDYPKYAKGRNSYIKKQVAYTALGVIFAILLVIGSGGRAISLLFGLLVIAFMFLLSILSYMPAVDVPEKTAEKLRQLQESQNKAKM